MDFWLDVFEMSEQEFAAISGDKLQRMVALLTEDERRLLKLLRRSEARRQRNAERLATIYGDRFHHHTKTWRRY